jgi:hypothetical protein
MSYRIEYYSWGRAGAWPLEMRQEGQEVCAPGISEFNWMHWVLFCMHNGALVRI